MSSSLGRIAAIGRTTFTELARLRVFYVLGLFTLVLSLLAIVATAQLLPRDLDDRVVYSVLAKPVRRFEYVLGKFFGALGLLVISLVAISILCLAVIHLREGAAIRETMQKLAQSPSDE